MGFTAVSSRASLIGALFVVVAAVGCRTVVSTVPPGEGVRGVPYATPKALVELTLDTESPDQSSLKVLAAVPDEDHVYVAQVKHTVFSSDDVTIETTASGLLSAVTTNADDKLGEIIVKLAETAKQVALFPGADSADNAVRQPLPDTVSVTFDPADPDDVGRANAALGDYGYSVRIDGQRGSRAPAAPSKEEARKGIVVRRAHPYLVEVRGGSDFLLSSVVVLPNEGDFVVVPIEAGPFVKTEYTMKFDSGLLTEMRSNRPSEVLGFVSILPDALKAIASIPAELVQLKIDTTKKDQELLEAQKALLESKKALEEARKELEEANANAGP